MATEQEKPLEQEKPTKAQLLKELVEAKVIEKEEDWDNLTIAQLQGLKVISGSSTKELDSDQTANSPAPVVDNTEEVEKLKEEHSKALEDLKAENEEKLNSEIVKRRTAEQNLRAFKEQVQKSAKNLLDSLK